MVRKKIMLEVDEEALKIIDEAAKKEYSTRTNFLIRNGVNIAKEVLKND